MSSRVRGIQSTGAKVDENNFLTRDDDGECTILFQPVTAANGIFMMPCRCAFVDTAGTIDHIKQNGKCLRCFRAVEAIFSGVRSLEGAVQTRSASRLDTSHRPVTGASIPTRIWTSPIVEEVIRDFVNATATHIAQYRDDESIVVQRVARAMYSSNGSAHFDNLEGRLANCALVLNESTRTRDQHVMHSKLLDWHRLMVQWVRIAQEMAPLQERVERMMQVAEINTSIGNARDVWHSHLLHLPYFAANRSRFRNDVGLWDMAYSLLCNTIVYSNSHILTQTQFLETITQSIVADIDIATALNADNMDKCHSRVVGWTENTIQRSYPSLNVIPADIQQALDRLKNSLLPKLKAKCIIVKKQAEVLSIQNAISLTDALLETLMDEEHTENVHQLRDSIQEYEQLLGTLRAEIEQAKRDFDAA